MLESWPFSRVCGLDCHCRYDSFTFHVWISSKWNSHHENLGFLFHPGDLDRTVSDGLVTSLEVLVGILWMRLLFRSGDKYLATQWSS